MASLATPLHRFFMSRPEDGTTHKSKSSQDRNAWRILHKLLRYTDDLNATDHWGMTPLHCLVMWNSDMSDTTQLILSRGADPRKRAINGATALHIAFVFSKLAALFLIMHDPSLVNVKDNDGVSVADLLDSEQSGPRIQEFRDRFIDMVGELQKAVSERRNALMRKLREEALARRIERVG